MAYEIAIVYKYDWYQKVLRSMVYNFFFFLFLFFFYKKIGLGVNVDEVIAQMLHKTLIEKFKKDKCIRGLQIIFGKQI